MTKAAWNQTQPTNSNTVASFPTWRIHGSGLIWPRPSTILSPVKGYVKRSAMQKNGGDEEMIGKIETYPEPKFLKADELEPLLLRYNRRDLAKALSFSEGFISTRINRSFTVKYKTAPTQIISAIITLYNQYYCFYSKLTHNLTMLKKSQSNYKHEVFFGIVAPIGTDLESVQEAIVSCLKDYSYEANVIKLSRFLPNSTKQIYKDQFHRYSTLMDRGNNLRHDSKKNHVMSLYAIAHLAQLRRTNGSNFSGTAHIFTSLKHQEESKLLRKTYAGAYFQIGVYSEEEKRKDFLISKKGIQEGKAIELIRRDETEKDKHGQQTQKTFHLSDFFIKHDSLHLDETKKQIYKMLDLVFSCPHVTPTIDEHHMFLAFSAATRSGDLSRQVGAVILDSHNDLIGIGANDVPAYKGGQYWPENSHDDCRDFIRGEDANHIRRNELIDEISEVFVAKKSKNNNYKNGVIKLKEAISKTGLSDITEYGRAAHAEMQAILSAARIGVSLRGATLFCTTFPCHNCAKHIVASGIKRVVFVEPYPKSYAQKLHGDSISVGKFSDKQVLFEPFIGVGPRRFFDLFSMNQGIGIEIPRKDEKTGGITGFKRSQSYLRCPIPLHVFKQSELTVALELREALKLLPRKNYVKKTKKQVKARKSKS